MWRSGSRLFYGMLAASIFVNAVAVYVLHDVDADRTGKLNLAYWELMQEFLIFAAVVTVVFLLVTWIGSWILGLQLVNAGLRLSFVLGLAVILIQYPAEFAVRLISGHTSDGFLLAYLLAAPICCAAIVLLDAHRKSGNRQSVT